MPVQASLLHFAVVGLGGFIGACTRFLIQNISGFDEKFLSTLLINVTGSFVIGVVWTILSGIDADKWWFSFLTTGILGGYTTYSSFSLDFVQLTQAGRWGAATFYAASTLLCAIAACMLAVFLTSQLLKYLR